MRKHYIAVFMAIVMCLAVLSGCSLLRSLEKDVNVVFEVNGEYVDGVTVNMFNNAIAPEFDETAEGAVPEGYKFMGWAAKHDWKYGDDRDLLISSGGIVRYDAVKDWANEGGTAVAVPIVIDRTTIPRADIVIAWYSNSGTSGISEANIAAFETELRAYLTEQGYDVSGLEIVIRGYGGNVGTSCGNIRKDGDVDIMLGWAGTSNLTGTGSMTPGKDVFENASNITIGEKARYAALCVDRDSDERELGVKVYDWIRGKYVAEGKESALENLKPAVTYKVTFNSNGGSDVTAKDVESGKTVQQPATPTKDGNTFDGWYTDAACTAGNEYDFSTPVTGNLTLYAKWTEGAPEPTTKVQIVIAWYSKTGTSGISQENINSVDEKLKAYLAGQEGYADVKVVFRAYDGDVKTSCGNIMTDNDVDIMLGWAANITTTGGMTVKQNVEGISIGTTARYAARLSDTDLCKLVYAWVQQEYGPKA